MNAKNFVQSAAKVFAVLKAFDAEASERTISQIAAHAQLDRGTAFRLVHTLRHLGYLAAVPDSPRFRLTLQCLELGYAALAHGHLTTHAHPLLRELVPGVAEAAALGVLDGPDVVYVVRIQRDASRPGMDRRIGSRYPAYAAPLGHAMLSRLPVDRQREILQSRELVKLSERTLTDLDALLDRLVLVRQRGYAVSDGENAYGLRTVAAPVLDTAGEPVAGVSLTIPTERTSLDDFVTGAVPQVLRVADALTQAIRLSFGAIAQNVPVL